MFLSRAIVAILVLLTSSCNFFTPSLEQQLQKAQASYERGDFLDAEKSVQPLYEKSKSNARVGRLYGDILLARGEARRARDVLTLLSSTDSISRSTLTLNLAFAHFILGNLDSAAGNALSALRDSKIRKDTALFSRAAHLLGRIAFNRGQLDSAWIYQKTSLRLARNGHLIKEEADALRQVGVLYWYQGKTDSALTACYEPALVLYRTVGDKSGEATTLSNMGLIYSQHEDWERNLRLQLEAYEIRKQIGDQIGLADSYEFLLYVPFVTKEGRTFQYSFLRKSYELSKRIGYAWGAEVAARNLKLFYSTILQRSNSPEGTEDTLLAPLSGEGRIYALQAESHRMEQSGDLHRAAASFANVIRLCDSLDYRSEKVSSLVHYGRVLTKLKQFREAERALMAARKKYSGEPWKREFVESQIAETYAAGGNIARAKRTLITMIDEYDSVYLRKLQESDASTAFENAMASIHVFRSKLYRQLITLLAEREDPDLFQFLERERLLPFWGGNPASDESFDSPSRRSYREFIQSLDRYESGEANTGDIQPILLQLGELRTRLLAEQSTTRAPKLAESILSPVSSTALQRSLGLHDVVLEYYVGEEQTFVLAVRKYKQRVLTIPVAEQELVSLVDLYRSVILRGKKSSSDDLWTGPSYQLYSKLLLPLVQQGMIEEGDHLMIAPQGVLHLVPFHALLVTEKTLPPIFSLERYFISYLPSSTSFVRSRAQKPEKIRSLLAVASGKPVLPFVEREVEQIPDELAGSVTRVKGSAAQADRFLREVGQYDVIHVASHARMNMRFPLYSSIQFTDRKLELHELLRQPLKARLVVLSMCESGLGMTQAEEIPLGEDLVSFPRALLAAGASSVLASQWLVEDESTAEIMNRFYQNLLSRASSSTPDVLVSSLISAQRQFLSNASQTGKKNHPFSWAPFFVVGDGR